MYKQVYSLSGSRHESGLLTPLLNYRHNAFVAGGGKLQEVLHKVIARLREILREKQELWAQLWLAEQVGRF